MPYRKDRLVTGHFYHVYNRGVEKRHIFVDKQDYQTFLSIIQWYLREDTERPVLSKIPKASLKGEVSLICYCLMPNHFHFLLQQIQDNGITQLMHAAITAYSMYFNRKYKRVGPLFQGRFKAKLVENDEYLLQVSKYIHRNPLPLLERPVLSTYEYSSYKLFLASKARSFCDIDEINSYFSKKHPLLSYQSFVEESESDLERIKGVIFDEE